MTEVFPFVNARFAPFEALFLSDLTDEDFSQSGSFDSAFLDSLGVCPADLETNFDHTSASQLDETVPPALDFPTAILAKNLISDNMAMWALGNNETIAGPRDECHSHMTPDISGDINNIAFDLLAECHGVVSNTPNGCVAAPITPHNHAAALEMLKGYATALSVPKGHRTGPNMPGQVTSVPCSPGDDPLGIREFIAVPSTPDTPSKHFNVSDTQKYPDAPSDRAEIPSVQDLATSDAPAQELLAIPDIPPGHTKIPVTRDPTTSQVQEPLATPSTPPSCANIPCTQNLTTFDKQQCGSAPNLLSNPIALPPLPSDLIAVTDSVKHGRSKALDSLEKTSPVHSSVSPSPPDVEDTSHIAASQLIELCQTTTNHMSDDDTAVEESISPKHDGCSGAEGGSSEFGLSDQDDGDISVINPATNGELIDLTDDKNNESHVIDPTTNGELIDLAIDDDVDMFKDPLDDLPVIDLTADDRFPPRLKRARSDRAVDDTDDEMDHRRVARSRKRRCLAKECG